MKIFAYSRKVTMELRLTESHDGHDRGAQIQRGGDTWLGAEKHS